MPVHVCNICLQRWTPDLKDLIKSGYWPASSHSQTLYTIDLFHSFQDLKVISPGFSGQAFAKLLEHRTRCAGRSGQINGDALQRSFLEFSYCSFEEDQLCCATPFTCLACTPEMVAVAADGNRKLYRFKRSSGFENTAFFEGLFLAKDSKVSAFVDTIRTAVKSMQGKATCGASQWAAARETSRRASKLDEEGVEVAVCRHGYLLKGLNMYRGDIFAYPLYLQREIQAIANFINLCHGCHLQVLAIPPKGSGCPSTTPGALADEAIPQHHACQGSCHKVLNGVAGIRRERAQRLVKRLSSPCGHADCPCNGMEQAQGRQFPQGPLHKICEDLSKSCGGDSKTSRAQRRGPLLRGDGTAVGYGCSGMGWGDNRCRQ
ncbi:uncharacterized protein LOC130120088 [Lampris incognitus]|uniref:uncharacterized protein LOC130120088 n=1 Tax=Lampris incognitus TaxID=2546036 RepID=UPI0024B533F1|nr:uncharacterized protein LOC130120088 [Lampris incognitus]